MSVDVNTSKLSDTAQILVSVINYRTAELTIQCVQSVLDDMQGIEGRVVIVDNASNDGSVEKLRTWISSLEQKEQVNLLEATSNSGFSGGHNQGILSQSADFYLILNSDAVLRPGFLSSMLNAAAQNPTIGLFAPKIEHDTGEVQTSCFRFHSPLSELARGAESGPVSKLLRTREVALAMPPSPDSIEWASFACILLRRETWSDTGPMDTGYFLYFEDVEYCWRARKAGWRIAYVQNAVGVHFRGGSGPVKSLAQERKKASQILLCLTHKNAVSVLWLVRACHRQSVLVFRPGRSASQAFGRKEHTSVQSIRMAGHLDKCVFAARQ